MRAAATRMDNQPQYRVGELHDISEDIPGRASWYRRRAARTSWGWVRRGVGIDLGKTVLTGIAQPRR